MNFISTLLLSFIIIFFAELGDKTQLIVLSLSTKSKIKNILLGIAFGTFMSHGLAIILGSKLGNLSNSNFSHWLTLLTYVSFILFGIVGFISMKKNHSKTLPNSNDYKSDLISKLINLKIHYTFIIFFCIFIGELGDKTFMSSIGLGIQYPKFKISLIIGSILGMVFSNMIAILFGRFISTKFKQQYIEIFSNVLFIGIGLVGLIFTY